ncbi:MAG: TlyA family RNA methyltransferase [Hydrogenibacillus sp.]|nr:TlyA family RNA methyltransferase [Hydrogenibacillus sp.]
MTAASKDKGRLDVLLVERGLFESREQARRAIMSGAVMVDGAVMDKPGMRVARTADIRLRGERPKYVSRGGLKLEAALSAFGIDLTGKRVLDAGASTGGFTDCALKHGAAAVIAVDVGYGQLAWSLRQDPRVIVKERQNVRYLRPEDLPVPPDVALADLSFISLGLVLPALSGVLPDGGALIALIKPQFEAGPEHVEKGGLVKDPRVHRETVERVMRAAEAAGLYAKGLIPSPIRGGDGNIEFLFWAQKGVPPRIVDEAEIARVVDAAHRPR